MFVTVGYAYATSTYATKLGRAKTGCYYTARMDHEIGTERSIIAHDNWAAAKAAADATGLKMSRYAMERDPQA